MLMDQTPLEKLKNKTCDDDITYLGLFPTTTSGCETTYSEKSTSRCSDTDYSGSTIKRFTPEEKRPLARPGSAGDKVLEVP